MPVTPEPVDEPTGAARADVTHSQKDGGQLVADARTVTPAAGVAETETSDPSDRRRSIARLRPASSEERPVAVRLHITHIPELDHLIALEYGRVDEGQPLDCWRPVGDPTGADVTGPLMAYLLKGAHGRAVGFKVIGASAFDIDAADVRGIWGRPLFDAPMLGLSDVSAGQVIVAARALFGARASVSHELFARAAEASGAEALGLWLAALEAGEPAAHWGLGCALLDCGRYRQAYRHLRYYTEIAPQLSWTWTAYGEAAEALGLDGEARAGYRRALELEQEPDETGARELLADLEARMLRHQRRRWWRRDRSTARSDTPRAAARRGVSEPCAPRPARAAIAGTARAEPAPEIRASS